MRGQIGPTAAAGVEMITQDSSHQRSNSDVCQKLLKCRRKCGSDSTPSLVLCANNEKGNISTKEAGEVMVDEYKKERKDLSIFFSLTNFLIIICFYIPFLLKRNTHKNIISFLCQKS